MFNEHSYESSVLQDEKTLEIWLHNNVNMLKLMNLKLHLEVAKLVIICYVFLVLSCSVVCDSLQPHEL